MLGQTFCVFSISKVHIKVKAWTDGTIYSTCQEVVLFLFLVNCKELFCPNTMHLYNQLPVTVYRCTECTAVSGELRCIVVTAVGSRVGRAEVTASYISLDQVIYSPIRKVHCTLE